jgi:hypothetical protein
MKSPRTAAKRRAARRAARRKTRMDLETGRYAVTEKIPKMTRRVPVDDDLLDRAKQMDTLEQAQLRHQLKKVGLEHLAPPPRNVGAPKKPKPE